MIVAHSLVDTDSLPSLALKYLGSALRAGEIADYNRLSYPYILRDKSELKEFFGSGYVTITRANYRTPLIIRKGWTFQTNPSLFTGNTTRVFEVVEDTVMDAGVTTCIVPLRCTVSGSFGNVMGFTITEVGLNTAQLSGAQFLSIYNELEFSGGRSLDVLVTGDTIYIPTDYSAVVPDDIEKMLDFIGGEDLVLDIEGDLVIEEGGDLASVHGVDNIRYAVTARLKTEIMDFTYHPEYGTDIQDLVGRPNVASREKLMEIAIYRSLAQENRITGVTIYNVSIAGTTVSVDLLYKVAMNGVSDRVTLVI